MLKYNTIFQSDKDFRTFVSEAEKNYKDQIKKIANKIQEDEEIRFLTLAGPTCSGKTTTSHILEEELGSAGFR